MRRCRAKLLIASNTYNNHDLSAAYCYVPESSVQADGISAISHQVGRIQPPHSAFTVRLANWEYFLMFVAMYGRYTTVSN